MTCCCREISSAEVHSALVEVLAELAHEQWSGWMNYLFRKCSPIDGEGRALAIPDWAVTRWRRQAVTPYAELSEEEKKSDRVEAEKVIALLKSKGYI